MNSKSFILIGLLVGGLLLGATWAMQQPPSDAQLRGQADRLRRDGNWADALTLYRQLIDSQETDPQRVALDLRSAVECLGQLGQTSQLDALLQSAVTTHSSNWRLLAEAARQLLQAPAWGGMRGQTFVRADEDFWRRGGQQVSASEPDRQLALMWLQQAVRLTADQAPSTAIAQLHLELAGALLHDRADQLTWRLQTLTDLTEAPSYQDLDQEISPWEMPQRYAPATPDGQPVLHELPSDWEAATSDGQRLRWALAMVGELDAGLLPVAQLRWASFLNSQFATSTLAELPWLPVARPGSEPRGDSQADALDDAPASGIWELNTLSDTETIARLAIGVKRFDLPDEQNPIRIWQQLVSSEHLVIRRSALARLAETYSDRRQFSAAAEQYRQLLELTPEDPQSTPEPFTEHAWLLRMLSKSEVRQRLTDIVEPRGMLEGMPTGPAGQPVSLELVFRNATRAEFTAHRLDVEKLIADTRDFFRQQRPGEPSSFGGRPNTGPPGFVSPNSLVDELKLDRYVLAQVAQWNLSLTPRENHWDRRLTINSPLQDPGLYVVTVDLDSGGHTARVLVWIQDTALVRKPVDGGVLYHLADSRTGQPIAGATVELFGYGPQLREGGRPNRPQNWQIEQLAKRTDAAGQLVLSERDVQGLERLQWLVTARSADGRRALLGFDGLWISRLQQSRWSQMRAYGVSERPMYRPGETVQAKIWLGQASYDPQVLTRPQAGQTVEVQLVDPEGNRVASVVGQTDHYGGIAAELPIPQTGRLGRYSVAIRLGPPLPPDQADRDRRPAVGCSLAVRVEEYRKPEFEVSIDAPQEPIRLGDTFSVAISARYFFGSPVTEAMADIKVERTPIQERFFPVRPFDWLYGPGYGWLQYDPLWHPTYTRWAGLQRPAAASISMGRMDGGFGRMGGGRGRPGMWAPEEPAELVLSESRPIGPDGRVEIEIDSALAQAFQGDRDHRYRITAEVRDASRRVESGTGEVIAARQAFQLYCWSDRGFYRPGDRIQARFQARTLSGQPVRAQGELTLLRLRYGADGQPTEQVVERWPVATGADGLAEQLLEAGPSGQYRLSLTLTDSAGHTLEGGSLITVRGPSDRASDFRYTPLELVPEQSTYRPGETVKLRINSDRDDARVLLFIRPENGICPLPKPIQLQAKSEVVEIEVTESDQPNFFVEAVSIYGGRIYQEMIEIIVPPEERQLEVTVRSDRSEYLPGQEAELELRISDAGGRPVEGSLAVAVYDRALQSLGRDVLPPDIRQWFWKWQRGHYPQRTANLDWSTYPVELQGIPSWVPLGIFGDSIGDDEGAGLGFARRGGGMGGMALRGGGILGAPGGMLGGAMPMMAEAAMADGMVANAAPMEKRAAGGEAEPADSPAVRQDFADAAFWQANLTTDRQGRAVVRFKMPENLTDWHIGVWSVGDALQVGSGQTSAVTRKRLMVRLQAPRFLIERDRVVLSALINNDFDTDQSVAVTLEVEGVGELTLEDSSPAEQIVTVPAGSSARVDWSCRAISSGDVTLRVTAIGQLESDAMQTELPIRINGTLKTDSWAGTLAADQDATQVAVRIPEQRLPEQSRLTVRLSPSLALAMLDSLPYLVQYPYGCTEQTLNRFLPTVITHKLLVDMGVDLAALEAARPNLNPQELGAPEQRRQQWGRGSREPVYDAAEVERLVEQGLQRLAQMQLSDGGWGWFSGPIERSGPHTTAVVVRGLLVAQAADVPVVQNVLDRGLDWLTHYQNDRLEKLTAPSPERPGVPRSGQPDNIDALVFSVLAEAGRFEPRMQALLFEQRLGLSGYALALLALAADRQGDAEQVAMLRQNLEQFLVEDLENQTAYLRDRSPWWYWYGSPIEANAMYLKLLSRVDPQSATAPRLVKYLLNNRKHATYWDSTRDTALVVEAFGDYLAASGEVRRSSRVEVRLGGRLLKSFEFTPETLLTAPNSLELVGVQVPAGSQQLELRRVSGDGPVYWNVYATNFTLEEEMAPSGLEIKLRRQYYLLEPVEQQWDQAGAAGQVVAGQRAAFRRVPIEQLEAGLLSGQRVECELVIESKNDYEYVMLEDRKPAGLEAIDQQSGYYSSGGMWVYRELRAEQTGLFIRTLPRGEHTIRYQLRAEAPGAFWALPAAASGMYAPELSATSANQQLPIADN